jgi:hypothetical protein
VLAYLFWHWPAEPAEAGRYERELKAFHRGLGEAAPEGFQGSAAFRVSGLPWVAAGGEGYEDWYLVEGSFALDPLNEVAVGPDLRQGHDRVARAAAKGVGGLLRMVGEGSGRRSAPAACWFEKPRGTAYAELYELLEPWTQAPGASLWRRQMVLGPSPEFCLLTPTPVDLPRPLAPVYPTRAQVL